MKSSDSFGQIYSENAKERAVKKSIGSFYTPHHLATSITNEILDRWFIKNGNLIPSQLETLSQLKNTKRVRLLTLLKGIKILDPAVGEGVFLLAAASWLNSRRIAVGDDTSAYDRVIDIVRNSLYGVDIRKLAIDACRNNLGSWIQKESTKSSQFNVNDITSILQGNSLLGSVNGNQDAVTDSESLNDDSDVFHWYSRFKRVLGNSNPGFDIVLGNPPYGNILDSRERQYIERTYKYNVGRGHDGSWNSAVHFIVRARALLRNGGQLGFLLPNSILRVNQFSKARRFLLESMCLWKIIDEGSPFQGVTLEMITIFCEKANQCSEKHIVIESRRPGYEIVNRLNIDTLQSSNIFSIYHDPVFAFILKRGQRNSLRANRGRDIPKDHVKDVQTDEFSTRYITRGRSVNRYHINDQWSSFTDDWFRNDSILRESFENELLVATKNYRFPRCTLKPKGVIHGGGIVKITPSLESTDLRALGLILNSRLVKQICIRYLTNYSQLTTCLNTGIMNDLPIVYPKHPEVFAFIFDALSKLYSGSITPFGHVQKHVLERFGDTLVYELYFSDSKVIENILADKLGKTHLFSSKISRLNEILVNEEVMTAGKITMEQPYTKQVERSIQKEESKSLRY